MPNMVKIGLNRTKPNQTKPNQGCGRGQ